jgi:hypothetical protein
MIQDHIGVQDSYSECRINVSNLTLDFESKLGDGQSGLVVTGFDSSIVSFRYFTGFMKGISPLAEKYEPGNALHLIRDCAVAVKITKTRTTEEVQSLMREVDVFLKVRSLDTYHSSMECS